MAMTNREDGMSRIVAAGAVFGVRRAVRRGNAAPITRA